MRYRIIFHKKDMNKAMANPEFASVTQALAHVKNAEIHEHELFKEYKDGGLIEVYDMVSECGIHYRDI